MVSAHLWAVVPSKALRLLGFGPGRNFLIPSRSIMFWWSSDPSRAPGAGWAARVIEPMNVATMPRVITTTEPAHKTFRMNGHDVLLLTYGLSRMAMIVSTPDRIDILS